MTSRLVGSLLPYSLERNWRADLSRHVNGSSTAVIRVVSRDPATTAVLIDQHHPALVGYEELSDRRCALTWRLRVDTVRGVRALGDLLGRIAQARGNDIAVGGAIVAGLGAWSEALEGEIIALAHGVADAVKCGKPVNGLAVRAKSCAATLTFWRGQRNALHCYSPAPRAVGCAVGDILHDLPKSLGMVDLALSSLDAGEPVPETVIARLRFANIHLDLWHIVRAAITRSAEEMEWHGCPTADSMVLDQQKSATLVDIRVTPEARRRLRDNLANLLTNGARYCREELAMWIPGAYGALSVLRGSEEGRQLLELTRRVEVWIRQLPGGALEVTCEDNGIGLHPGVIPELGTHGVMIGEKVVVGQSGIGLASVLAKGWGPLFYQVKHAPDGTRCGTIFRCYVSADAVTSEKAGTPVTWRAVIEQNASEGFAMLPVSEALLPADRETPV